MRASFAAQKVTATIQKTPLAPELCATPRSGAVEQNAPCARTCRKSIWTLRSISAEFRARIRWHINHHIRFFLPFLNLCRARLTVENAFGSPGDALLSATFIRNLKRKFPRLRVNLITKHSELFIYDPNIDVLNSSETFFWVRFWYLDILLTKDGDTHVLQPSCRHVGLEDVDVRAAFYLSEKETSWARTLAAEYKREIITINIMSRELVKVWPASNWQMVIDELAKEYSVVQLGDSAEPMLRGVHRLAGILSLRQSVALLSRARLHIGPDSFLMHAANGVEVPAVIIFGGSRTPRNLGYHENTNLFRALECGPCFIHTSKGERCAYDVKCMSQILPQEVLAAAGDKLSDQVARKAASQGARDGSFPHFFERESPPLRVNPDHDSAS